MKIRPDCKFLQNFRRRSAPADFEINSTKLVPGPSRLLPSTVASRSSPVGLAVLANLLSNFMRHHAGGVTRGGEKARRNYECVLLKIHLSLSPSPSPSLSLDSLSLSPLSLSLSLFTPSTTRRTHDIVFRTPHFGRLRASPPLAVGRARKLLPRARPQCSDS